MILQDFYKESYSEAISKLFLKGIKRYKSKALFLDRDGVLIEDVGYIDTVDKVKLCPNVIPFLEKARQKDFDLIVLTNQSSVSRGIITYERYVSITEAFLSKLPKNLYPQCICASFHLPENSNNLPLFNWRKPGRGMFEYILNRQGYNGFESIMIGDKLTDLLPAYELKLNKIYYVNSKLHKTEIEKITTWNKKHSDLIKVIEFLDPNYL